MRHLWVLCLLFLTSASHGNGYLSDSLNDLDGTLQDGCSGPEDLDDFMEEEEEIEESVIEAWSKAYRTHKYEDPAPMERQTLNCTGKERSLCLGLNGTCQSKRAECLGDRYQGRNFCASRKICACCSPSECNLGTKPMCSETCHGTCMNRRQRCPGYFLLGQKYCSSARGCKCCVKPPKNCRYQGVKYSHGTQLPGTCMEILCQDGEWCPSNKISRDCTLCYIRDDPHFDTFDDSVYDWHGQCNYSLTQSDQSYNATYGVYGDLDDCMDGATCLVTVVFKDNPNTVITLGLGTDVFEVNINGNNYTFEKSDCAQYLPGTDVLAWNVGDCIRILGTQGLVLNFCYILGHYQELYIWEPPRLDGSLYGLCGHNNGIEGDDFVLRNGSIIPWDNFAEQFSFPYPIAPEEFPEDWQTDPSCNPSHARQLRGVNISADFPCQASDSMWFGYQAQCEHIVDSVLVDGQALSDSQKRRYTATCIFDMCMIYQASTNNANVSVTMTEWETAVETMVKQRIEIQIASRVCPAGFDVVGTECFKIHDKFEPWSIARLLCQAEGTYLAQPSNSALLLAHLQAHGKTNHYWLGGRGNGTNMVWTRSREVVNGLLYQSISNNETEVIEPLPTTISKDYCLEIRAESMSGPLALWECTKRHYFICQYNNKYAYN